MLHVWLTAYVAYLTHRTETLHAWSTAHVASLHCMLREVMYYIGISLLGYAGRNAREHATGRRSGVGIARERRTEAREYKLVR